jgi:predicted nucleic acid-binding protein
MSNALLQAERRKRIIAADVTAIWALVDNLPIETDPESPARKRRDVWSLARQHRLTVYDAAYLELSIRTGLPLATRDADLAGAAESCGVPVLPKKLKRS